jgi:3-phosphoshikimate 1-carboxyvinyltransferase
MARLYIDAPSQRRQAAVEVPGDKSVSHRALMLGAIAAGTTNIRNLNVGADVASTMSALRLLGVPIETAQNGVSVAGVDAFAPPATTIDCGNSGTTMRLLAGLLAGRVGAKLDGDASLRRRPMERVAQPLRWMGARVDTTEGRPPLVVHNASEALRGIRFVMDIASAQVKSAVLLAGLRADGETVVVEPEQTRDHTERMLAAMGARISVDGRTISIEAAPLSGLPELSVPGDFSAAFFFIAAAAASPHGAGCTVLDVGMNPTRTAALDVVRAMGADVRVLNERTESGEPRADIEARGMAALQGVDVPIRSIPNLIDEVPALCALASVAGGEFTIRGAAELRAKESDRIATTSVLLRSFGVAVEEHADGLTVRGGRRLRPPTEVDTHGDHRIGMAAAVLACAAGSPLTIENATCIATSFPNFAETWRAAFG